MSYKKRTGFNFVLVCFLLSIASLNIFAGEFTVFNKTYIRGTGSPTSIVDNFNVPNPNTTWTLKAINGSLEDDTVETVSSSTLILNNEEVLQSNQFNQNTNLITVPVTLNSTNTISTTLKGKPGGQLAVEIVGIDDIVPLISNLTPSSGTLLNNSQPQISAQYSDDISGIDINSLVILLDGNNVVSESNITTTSFDFTPNDPLNDGIHTLFVSVQDNAGNQAQTTITFTTDITAPIITSVNPADGSTTSTAQPTISANYSDATSGIDINAAKITLDGTNITSQATVTATSISFTSATNLSEGVHTAVFEVNDLAGNSDTAQTNFTIPTSNTAPTIGPIGNRSVDVGSTLRFTVTASDTNNDDITLFVTPLPLLENVSFNATTGAFAISPAADQIGDHTLTFIASDGTNTDEETITITVLPLPGVTSLKGNVITTNSAPLANVRLVVGVTNPIETFSQQDGSFFVTGLPSGKQRLLIDGSTVDPALGTFATVPESIELIQDANNELKSSIVLLPLDVASGDPIIASQTSIITSSPFVDVNGQTIGPATLTVAPNTATLESTGQPFSGNVYITNIPDTNLGPQPLPSDISLSVYIAIQPFGVHYCPPAPISFPNVEGFAPGSILDIFGLNHNTGVLEKLGEGIVSADGSAIDSVGGVVKDNSWHGLVPQAPSFRRGSQNNAKSDKTEKQSTDCLESGVSIQGGDFFEDYTLVPYRSLGLSRSLKFVYHSTNADPRPIFTGESIIGNLTPPPETMSTNLNVGGIDQGVELFTGGNIPQIPGGRFATVRSAVQFDSSMLQTGLYPYTFTMNCNFPKSRRSTNVRGEVIVNNQINSPFGSGWTLDGIQKLHDLNSQSGDILLTDGNGSAKMFNARLEVAFSSPTNFPVGSIPNSVAAADFNGDNLLDLVTANSNSDNVSILIGDGAGNFSPTTNFPVGGVSPNAVAAADINGDNLLDLATANSNSNNVSILIGDGAGNFSSPANFPVGGISPVSIVAGDFNGDNLLDLATANSNSDNVSILISDCAGNFMVQTDIPVGNDPRSIVTGDFNGDNVLDLATANLLDSTVSVLLGDDTGNFPTQTDIPVGNGPISVVTGDFNGDDVLDLATANLFDDTVSVLLGDGVGNFSFKADFPVGIFFANEPVSIVTGDFDGDNVLDLATANNNANNVSILLGDGAGNFSFSPPYFSVGFSPVSIISGDFNGDDVLDFATANSNGDNVSTRIGLGITAISKSPPGDFSTLVKNVDNTFTRFLKDGTEINFDVNGLHTSTVDRNGNTTTYTYDQNGLLATITDPAGLVTILNYQSGRLSSVTDPVGRITNFQHDSNGNLTKIIAPDNAESSYTYDSRHLMTTETDPNGNTHTINYSFSGRYESMDFADGSTRQLSPTLQKGLIDLSIGVGDSASNPAPHILSDDADSTLTDGNGNVTTIKTDNFGAITQSTDNCCLGRITEIERDGDGLPTKVTRANGAVILMTYDERGNLLTLNNQAIGATTTFTYDTVFNQVTSITDPNGNTTTINYDATGNPIEIVDAQGNTSTQTFNSKGQLTSVTDALGNTATFTFNADGNLETIIDPLLNVTTLTTDSAGNVITATDANGNITQFAYDALNKLIQVTDANNNITIYNYDSNGNRIQITDANANITTFVYDSMDRLIMNTDPLGNSDTLAYDGNGNIITTTNRNAQTINLQYDSLNQLIKKTLPGNLITSFNYDLVGNLTSITDPDSNLTFSYDGADRLLSAATTGSPNQPEVTIGYVYDSNGNRITMTDSLTGITNYVYDDLNRVTNITNPANQSVSFSYDVLNRRSVTTLPNGVTKEFTYDANNRVTSLQHKLGVTTISGFSYIYDNVGNRTVMNTTRTGASVNSSLIYVYDSIYQLTQATRPLTAQSDESFIYDPLGNRLQRDGQIIDSIIGQANRLLDDTTYTYTYDNNGNLIQKTDKATNETTDYTYDAENQLIQINLPSGSIAQYHYDGLGRRIVKDVDGVITKYLYDSEDILLEFDGTNIQIARYTHGLGVDEPLIMERGGQISFYNADGLGSITDLTDSSGNVVQSYVYDSFGKIKQQIGSIVNPYTYTSREYDAESSLYYYRARYYDKSMGRFINEDPIGLLSGSLNFYGYVQNNPVNWIDPLGFKTEGTDVSFTAGAGKGFTFGITFVNDDKGNVGIVIHGGGGGYGGANFGIAVQDQSTNANVLSDLEGRSESIGGSIAEPVFATGEKIFADNYEGHNKGLGVGGGPTPFEVHGFVEFSVVFDFNVKNVLDFIFGKSEKK